MDLGQTITQLAPNTGNLKETLLAGQSWIEYVQQMLTKYYAHVGIQKDRELAKNASLDYMLTSVGKESRELAHAA
jgi:hypothetical protein